MRVTFRNKRRKEDSRGLGRCELAKLESVVLLHSEVVWKRTGQTFEAGEKSDLHHDTIAI